MALKHYFRSLLVFTFSVLSIPSLPSMAQEIHADLRQPSIEKGSRVFVDIDTVHQQLYLVLDHEIWNYDLVKEKWAFLDSIDLTNFDDKFQYAYDHTYERLLFWSDGVGIVVEYDLDDQVFNRIDNSFSHKNQYGHVPFFRNGSLHAFGGYGFWDWHNIITYYNNELEEWSLLNVEPESDIPAKRVAFTGTYIPSSDELYIYGGTTSQGKIIDDKSHQHSLLNDIWKFDFKSSKWQKLYDEKDEKFLAYKRFPISRTGLKNGITTSMYSNNSMTWYIPMAVRNSSPSVLYLKPVRIDPFEVYQPIEILDNLDDKNTVTNFLFDPKSKSIVLIAFVPLTNSSTFPIDVIIIPEDSLLSRMEVQEQNKFTLHAGVAGAFFLVLCALILFIRNRKSSESEKTEVLNYPGSFDTLPWLSDDELKMLHYLWGIQGNVDASGIEEKIWPEIKNFDYRRKIRNDTINSINSKFRKKMDLKEDLINRQKDPTDNRRYKYSLIQEVLD